MSVFLVKSSLISLQFLVGINLIAKCEYDAQIFKLALSDRILEDSQTVVVSGVRSRLLLKYEDG